MPAARPEVKLSKAHGETFCGMRDGFTRAHLRPSTLLKNAFYCVPLTPKIEPLNKNDEQNLNSNPQTLRKDSAGR